MPTLLMAPVVSTAIGTNKYDCVSGVYLAVFLSAAASAAAPCSCLRCHGKVGLCQRVDHCNVLRDTSSALPWYECDTIGPFAIIIIIIIISAYWYKKAA